MPFWFSADIFLAFGINSISLTTMNYFGYNLYIKPSARHLVQQQFSPTLHIDTSTAVRISDWKITIPPPPPPNVQYNIRHYPIFKLPYPFICANYLFEKIEGDREVWKTKLQFYTIYKLHDNTIKHAKSWHRVYLQTPLFLAVYPLNRIPWRDGLKIYGNNDHGQ